MNCPGCGASDKYARELLGTDFGCGSYYTSQGYFITSVVCYKEQIGNLNIRIKELENSNITCSKEVDVTLVKELQNTVKDLKEENNKLKQDNSQLQKTLKQVIKGKNNERVRISA